MAASALLFVGPQESGHFGAQQFDEGAREHLLGLLGRVLEVVLGVCQHVEEGLDQLLVLQDRAGRPSQAGPQAGGPGRPPGALRGPSGVCKGVGRDKVLGWLVGVRTPQMLFAINTF